MTINESIPLPAAAWGFDSEQIMNDAETINWQDKDLLASFVYCFKYYAQTTRFLCTVSPHQAADKQNVKAFF